MRKFAPAVVALVLAAPAQAHRGGMERVYRLRCDQQHPVACVHRAAIHRRVSFSWLKSTAWCESRFNPYATNGIYAGMFQFGPVWWSTPYRHHSRFSAKWASLAAARAFAHGQSSMWECA